MSNLFMDMHRRRCRTSATTTTTTTPTTSESPSSTQYENDHIFSHHNKSSTAGDNHAAGNANCKFNNRQIYKDDQHDDENHNDDDDAFGNILSLKLRKPKHWKWELSTSKSCSNIALPRILLYDHKGELLVDAQDAYEAVYKQEDREKPKAEKRSYKTKTTQQSEYQQRSATTNLMHSIQKAVEQEFNGLHIEEATPSPEPKSKISFGSHRSRNAIDLSTTDLPDYGLSRRSSSLRGVRFNVKNDEDCLVCESQIPEFLPTPPSTTTTPTSSSSGPRGKRKYRRSQSSGRSSAHSESILERFSYQKGRFSSPEYAEEHDVQQAPRYFMRTCKAGTLVVKEDSFNLHPRRRRRRLLKNRSSESLQTVRKSFFPLTIPKQQQLACNSPTPSDISCNEKQQPTHRQLSDRNIFLNNKQLSTSEEDVAVAVGQKQLLDSVDSRHLQRYAQARNQTKDSTDVNRNGKVR